MVYVDIYENKSIGCTAQKSAPKQRRTPRVIEGISSVSAIKIC